MEGASLGVRTFTKIPSAAEFEHDIESRNIPAVFRGCIKDWEAYSKWNPSNGGLDYLEERIGSLKVEAMLSRSAPVFYGDLRSHERVQLPFSTFSKFCKQHKENKVCSSQNNDELNKQRSIPSDLEDSCSLPEDAAPHQVYLAQVSIMNVEAEQKVQLPILKEDIQTPSFLETKSLSSVNFWMNGSHARSSTHYDPHHNLLCVIAGCKKVVLWPPSTSPMLYPMPIYGEASNHSSVALEKPDVSVNSRAEHLMEYAQQTILYAGDGLFIPEGWFHQIDSDQLTIAVNLWWQSNIMSSLSEHMDSYYLRQIVRRLIEREKILALPKSSSSSWKSLPARLREQCCKEQIANDCSKLELDQYSEGTNLNQAVMQQQTLFHGLEPSSLQAFYELVSLVHDRINVLDPSQAAHGSLMESSEHYTKCDSDKPETDDIFHLEDDPFAKIIWTLEPSALQSVLIAMAHKFPRTLEALIFHLLSPVAAEVLTQKFEEMERNMDQQRNNFYEVFYAAFDDPHVAMDTILNKKESFAYQAFKNVLEKYLGVNIDLSKS